MKRLRQPLIRTVATLAIAIAPVACSPVATSPAGDGDVQAVSVRVLGEVRVAVTNRSSSPVFTVTHGRNVQPLILWAACADAAQCPPIAPGATRLDDPGLIEGMPETEAVVNWWHAERGDDGVTRPDSIRSIIVKL